MSQLLVLIHTVPPLISVFDKLVGEILPGVRPKHLLDEPLLERINQRGGLDSSDADRLLAHVHLAEEIGAATVLVTCSTISPLVDQVRNNSRVPVLKIDEVMIARAVQAGRRIGVLATNRSTLEPTCLLLADEAGRLERNVAVEQVLITGALESLLAGDGERHDMLVRQAILETSPRVDVIVLAQASMARVLETLPESERLVPVYSSPHLALGRVKELLAG